MGDFAITIQDIDGDEDYAGFDAGQIEVDHFDAISEVDAEAIAFGEAAGEQQIGQAVAAPVKIGEGEHGALEFQSRAISAGLKT